MSNKFHDGDSVKMVEWSEVLHGAIPVSNAMQKYCGEIFSVLAEPAKDTNTTEYILAGIDTPGIVVTLPEQALMLYETLSERISSQVNRYFRLHNMAGNPNVEQELSQAIYHHRAAFPALNRPVEWEVWSGVIQKVVLSLFVQKCSS